MRERCRNLAIGIAFFSIALVDVCSVIGTACAADTAPPDDAFIAAISTNPDALETLLAERFTYRTSRSSTIGKQALIDELRSGRTRVNDPQLTNSSSTTQGDTTVSVCVVTLRPPAIRWVYGCPLYWTVSNRQSAKKKKSILLCSFCYKRTIGGKPDREYRFDQSALTWFGKVEVFFRRQRSV